MQRRTLVSWSSGKDSAWSLHLLLRNPAIEVAALLTTFNTEAGRVAMHAVRRELVEAQAASLGLPLWPVELPWPCPNAEYESRMHDACRRAVADSITNVAFGDLFLADIRAYRERQLEGSGLSPVFPVWQIPTDQLARRMLQSELKARVTCVDLTKLDRSFAGREYDAQFLNDLPAGIDPCGENGEFHTFVYDSPDFDVPIHVTPGTVIERDGFAFADLIPASGVARAASVVK
jgi:uncharacterized protein (TIGR00290 family)